MILTPEQKQQLLDRGLNRQQIDNLERTGGKTSVSPQAQQRGVGGFVGGVGGGFLKGVGSTLFGLGTLAERGISAITGKKREEIGIVGEEKPESLIPQTTAEKIGYGIETIAEFLLPSTAVLKATKGFGLVGRMAVEAGLAGGLTAMKEGEINNQVKTNAIIAAAFPVLGTTFRIAKQALGRGAIAGGEKIIFTKIRPTAADIADGFKVGNLKKHNLVGSVGQMFSKTQNKLNELTSLLKSELKLAQNKAVSETPIDLNSIYKKTVDILKRTKARQFGDIKATGRAFSHLKEEILLATGRTGKVDIFSAQAIKQGAGRKGAWAYNRVEPDANAIEEVYSAFYRELKKELEYFGGGKIKIINKQISELISISNAIIRRMPVEARNNVISLTDSIALYSSIFDPKALMLLGAQKLSKSGRFANVLIKAGESLKKVKPKTAIGQRFIR